MPLFVSSTLDFSGDHEHALFVGGFDHSEPELISLEQICSSKSEIVIFETTAFVSLCKKRKVPLPESIVDVFQIYKLIQGKPSKLYRHPSSKVIWEIFKNIALDKDQLRNVISELNKHSGKIDEKILSSLKLLNLQFKIVYNELLSQLKERNEYERFRHLNIYFFVFVVVDK